MRSSRHQIELLNQKIDQQQKDFSYRLCMVSAQQLGAGDQGLNCAATGAPLRARRPVPGGLTPGQPLPPIDAIGDGAAGFVAAPAAACRPALRLAAAGHLGTLPMASGPAAAGSAVRAAPVRPNIDAAMNLLRQGAI